MTNTLPIHELVQELRRADINISANVSENLHGILDFSYESPMEFNGHASLVTYEQFLNGIYTNNVGQLKFTLQNACSVSLERLLVDVRIAVEELKQEFTRIGKDISLSHAKVHASEWGELQQMDIIAVKKKRCCSSDFSIAIAVN
ncbi:hypothetical protein OAI64_02935 [Schleiferiaceae bacterium]|jgi:hypothetical protein|nr:hypothetical protein [Schleiferiaceae bacterium]PTM13087.1 MAG: hypothetical protein DA445_08605 [Bacteroidota bacterium]MDB9928928.1 hypothetical protein [Schleiferiaceae bacterium]MDC0083154.1 hypothetical protein [Schleiferiaceae bacterium]MDC0118655.1 hypothetical protein [Schleiferiaceae bacterium]